MILSFVPLCEIGLFASARYFCGTFLVLVLFFGTFVVPFLVLLGSTFLGTFWYFLGTLFNTFVVRFWYFFGTFLVLFLYFAGTCLVLM